MHNFAKKTIRTLLIAITSFGQWRQITRTNLDIIIVLLRLIIERPSCSRFLTFIHLHYIFYISYVFT